MGQPVVPVAQEILGEIEPGTVKPSGTGHLGDIVNHLIIGHRGIDRGEIPHLFPELGEMVDGPLIEPIVTIERCTVALVDQRHEPVHVGGYDLRFRRLP